jgi:hypothetical protein
MEGSRATVLGNQLRPTETGFMAQFLVIQLVKKVAVSTEHEEVINACAKPQLPEPILSQLNSIDFSIP